MLTKMCHCQNEAPLVGVMLFRCINCSELWREADRLGTYTGDGLRDMMSCPACDGLLVYEWHYNESCAEFEPATPAAETTHPF